MSNKFKLGDKVIVTKFYKNYPSETYPIDSSSMPMEINSAIKEKTVHTIIDIKTNSTLYSIGMEDDSFYEDELEFASVNSWKKVVEG